MHALTLSLFLPLFLLNPTISYGSEVSSSKGVLKIMGEGRSSQMEAVLEKLMSDISILNRRVQDLHVLHLRTTKDIVDGIMDSCVPNRSPIIVPASFSTNIQNTQYKVSSTNKETTNNSTHAIRCSGYRALDEFVPVEEVKSNDMLIEAGWDSVNGPLYFCHTLVDVNGIKCRLYGKGNRRSCWVITPSGREHRVNRQFHLLKKPEGVNVEWRSSWPTDLTKAPVPELKTAGGVVYEWAVWDTYTCGLSPRFYFGRCDKNGMKNPGLIHAGQSSLKFPYSGREESCNNYDVLVCVNK